MGGVWTGLRPAPCHGQGAEAFWPDPGAYTEAVHHPHRAGVGTATHAIGDAYRADLTAFGLDPVEAPADELGEAPVRLTVTGGRIAHHS